MADSSGLRVTRIGLLVVIVLVGILLAVLVPGIQHARETARRARCIGNMKEVGLAICKYHEANRFLPAAGTSLDPKNPDPAIAKNPNGFSFLRDILPYLEPPLSLQSGQGDDPRTNGDAMRLRVPTFACPSYTGPEFADAKNNRYAITNYKAMSGTSQASIAVGIGTSTTPPYGKLSAHPDGGLVPNKKMKISEITDGTAQTLVCCETIDASLYSYWALGERAALGVLKPGVNYVRNSPGEDFFCPEGFVKDRYTTDWTFADGPQSPYAQPNMTWFENDYKATPYETIGRDVMVYGPSSSHPRVIVCLFASGDVTLISREVDQGMLMFLATRAGGDPGPPFYALY